MRALCTLCLADAQSLTVLRAVKKGNAAGLVASLAADTAQMYDDALQTVSGCPLCYCTAVLQCQHRAGPCCSFITAIGRLSTMQLVGIACAADHHVKILPFLSCVFAAACDRGRISENEI